MAHRDATPLLTALAGFVVNHDGEFSQAATRIVRDSFIDTLGCMLIGAGEQAAVLSREALAGDHPGRCPVYGTSIETAPETAALLNAVAGHALDLDDWEIPGNSHSSVVLISAILAAAENRPLSGAEIRAAYVMGYEVIARLGEAVNFEHYARGWHTTGTLACIGAAAAVARLWKLDTGQAANAMSLAVTRASGLTRQFGSHAKPLQAGFAAENALRCARLARTGLSGQADILEGRQGYFAVTAHDDAERHQRPFRELGGGLAIEQYGQVIKPYPSCGYTHRIIDCAREHRRQSVDADDVAAIALHLPDFHAAILPFGQPSSRQEALFSLPYCAAMGLVQGDLAIGDLDDESWERDDVRALVSVSTVHPFTPARPRLNYDPEEPDRMEITLKSGESRVTRVAWPTGAPQNPLPLPALLEKFRGNAARFREPSAADVSRLENWPALGDVQPLVNTLGAGQHG